MPDRFLERHDWLKRWAWPLVIGLLIGLSITTVTISIVMYVQYGQLDDAERKVAGLEAAGTTAEVATCYASARGRPRVIVILRGLAQKLDNDPRDATNELIDQYEASTPSLQECDMLAVERGLSPNDFPPPRIPKQ